MALWLVTHPGGSGATLRGGNAMIVVATAAADAKAIAASQFGGDSGGWATATATELTETDVNTASKLTGWIFKIVMHKSGETTKEFSLTGAAHTLDEAGTALAALLNADDDIAGAGYTTATQALIVALGGGNDDLGDWAVTFTAKPPAVDGSGGQINDPKHCPGLGVVTTDEGAASANLLITLGADTLKVPTVKNVVKT